jgi:hypothetical protein
VKLAGEVTQEVECLPTVLTKKNNKMGGRGIRKSNKGAEFDQSTLYACMEDHNETLLYNSYTPIEKKFKLFEK